MKSRLGKNIVKWIGRVILGLILFVVLVLFLLYLPPVQNFIVPRVFDKINDGSEMKISVDRFRLSFPLDVSVEGVEIMQKGDTMLIASSADVSVALVPLLSGEIKADAVSLREVYYKSGTPDSTMYLRARVSAVDLLNSGIKLSSSDVDIDDLTLSGGRVDIALKPDTTPPTPPSKTDFRIHARRLALNDVDYRMTMLPSIDSLNASLGNLTLLGGDVDLLNHTVKIDDISISRIDARFLTPLTDQPAAPEPVLPDAVDTVAADTVPWTINLRHIALSDSRALYAKSGVVPEPGLDMDYLQLTRLDLDADSVMNRGAEIVLPLKKLSVAERSGLSLDASGLFKMTADEMIAEGFKLLTNASAIDLDARVGMGSGSPESQPVDARVGAEIAVSDLQMIMPSMSAVLAQLPQNRKITVTADVAGTMDNIDLSKLEVNIPRHLLVRLSGDVKHPTDLDRANGQLKLSGNLADINFIKPTLMDAKTGKTVNFPPLVLAGNVMLRAGTIGGDLTARTHEGKIALDATWNGRREAYNVSFDADKFPVHSFMPGLGLGNVTMSVDAKGNGLDFLNPKTNLSARVDAVNVVYKNAVIHDLTIGANIANGNGDVTLTSRNKAIDMTLDASGNLAGRQYSWRVAGDVTHLDLEALGMSDSLFDVAASFTGQATLAPKDNIIRADLDVASFDVTMGARTLSGRDLDLVFDTSDTLTAATVTNNDLSLRFTSPSMLDTLTSRLSKAMVIVDSAVVTRRIDVIALQTALPKFKLSLDAGPDNVASRYLRDDGTSFKSVTLDMSNDSLITLTAHADSIVSGTTVIDALDFDLWQKGKFLLYKAVIDNKPGTMDNFAHVDIHGFIADRNVAAFMKQRNIKGEVGYNVGAAVEMNDSTLKVKFIPVKPTIGYKEWTINPDNYILVNTAERHIDADLSMSNPESSLRLYTVHDSLSGDHHQEDIILSLSNVKIADWINLNPYAPPMAGDLSADIRLSATPTSLNGNGTVTLADFTYAKTRVGTLDLDVDLTTRPGGAIHAKTGLRIDGREVMTAAGNLNDTTAVHPFMLDVALTRFPLSIANPFIGKETATLDGYLNGSMDMWGSPAEPIFNGYLAFDSATAKVTMLGSTLRMSDEKIPVDTNVIRFDKYPIYAVNENPLTIDGSVDMHSLSNIGIDLSLTAADMQIVDNRKSKSSDVYGKAFISLDAKARGNMRFIDVDAALTVLPGTNVTYIIPTASDQLTMQSDKDMVKFVNFNDTTVVAKADSIVQSGMLINLSAILNIAQGSTIGVDLSTDGKNRVQVQSNGSLDFTMTPLGDTRFTGRLNIEKGYVRYTPPFMSEKLFDFVDGSYVAFNGDMMNPTLNVHAVDRMRANVTQEGQNSRLIYFDVSLGVTGTLQNMNVAFDLSTDDDVTVENELQSMSAEQRANQAMNLLLYNVYTGPGTKGSASLSGNPLYSFLESQLNSWMANNVKGVDISFGMDQYDRTVDGSSSTTTSYSYRVSKSFLDDRFKIVVGGNYSTDADTDENFSQNLINDISFEYMLNRSGSMYVRLFRHTGYESILEGEVTQTGVGFVYKRKLRTLRDLFRFGRGRRVPMIEQQGEAIAPTTVKEETDEKEDK